MTAITTASAAALATLILLLSCTTLWLDATGPQQYGVLHWLVTAGFALQAVGSAAWLVRLSATAWGNATDRGTQAKPRD